MKGGKKRDFSRSLRTRELGRRILANDLTLTCYELDFSASLSFSSAPILSIRAAAEAALEHGEMEHGTCASDKAAFDLSRRSFWNMEQSLPPPAKWNRKPEVDLGQSHFLFNLTLI